MFYVCVMLQRKAWIGISVAVETFECIKYLTCDRIQSFEEYDILEYME